MLVDGSVVNAEEEGSVTDTEEEGSSQVQE